MAPRLIWCHGRCIDKFLYENLTLDTSLVDSGIAAIQYVCMVDSQLRRLQASMYLPDVVFRDGKLRQASFASRQMEQGGRNKHYSGRKLYCVKTKN